MTAPPASGIGLSKQQAGATEEPILRLRGVQKTFPVRSGVFGRQTGTVSAVAGVDLELRKGETLGLVGETGCGKSTLARLIMGLLPTTAGSIEFEGQDITTLSRSQMRPLRREMQMIFQDPYGSLNPRRRVGSIIGDPFDIHGVADGAERMRQVKELMELVGLNPEHYNRFPADFSGGQRQRIGVARALALRPKLLVCDEPVSALDVSIQAQVINLLDDLQDEFGLSYVFIAHDLSVVRHVSDQIAVMYLGKLMELSPAKELYSKPIHPYTEALLSAIPIPDPRENRERERMVVGGEPPNPISPPPGCRFHTRCPRATEVCTSVEPPLAEYPGGHLAACHHPLNVSSAEVAGATRSPLSPLSTGEQMPDGAPAAGPGAPATGSEVASGTGEAADGGAGEG
jgi:oligopeptide/dipeptide ABC transporter ATP-binding protein